MAQYTIHHRCGHTSIAHLSGAYVKRNRRIYYLEQEDCFMCRAARHIDLKGTPKQIAWAADIRSQVVRNLTGDKVLRALFHRAHRDGCADLLEAVLEERWPATDAGRQACLRDALQRARQELLGIDEAWYWINLRRTPSRLYVQQVLNQYLDGDATDEATTAAVMSALANQGGGGG